MIDIVSLSVKFEDFELKDISLSVNKNDYLVVLGMSGAGKTVLLEAIAGIVKSEKGSILLNNKKIEEIPILQRKMTIIYQDLSLFPHLSVENNILYPLKIAKVSKLIRKQKLMESSTVCSVSHLLSRFPETLSGGEKQRVAIARALASDVDIILLDEPLSSLDINIKAEISTLLKKLHSEGKTLIHITHDSNEALSLATKVAVIENGRLIQTGLIEDVVQNPGGAYVASFFNSKNFFSVLELIEKDQSLYAAKVAENVSFFINNITDFKAKHIVINEKDILLSVDKISTSAINSFKGEISRIELSQHNALISIDVGIIFFVEITLKSFYEMKLQIGKEVYLYFKASAVKLI